MSFVDIYGNYNISTTPILSTGGLLASGTNLSIKIDPNSLNDLSLSSNGILGSGLKTDGSCPMIGNLNVPNNNVLIGNLSSAPNLSALCIKQIGQLNNDATNSTYGVKFYNNTDDSAYYIGYTNGGYFGIFNQTSAGIYTLLCTFSTNAVNGCQIYSTLGMNSNRINNVANPSSAQDAATKNYVDNAITSGSSANSWINGGNTVATIGAVIGTINNQPVNLIQNNIPVATLNAPNFEVPGNVLIGSGVLLDTNLAVLSIKQQGQLNNTSASSVYGLKFYNSLDDSSYYMGYNVTNELSIGRINSLGNSFKCMSLGVINSSFVNLDMKTNLINNLNDPVATTDAANKRYVDNSITTEISAIILPLMPLVPPINGLTTTTGGGTPIRTYSLINCGIIITATSEFVGFDKWRPFSQGLVAASTGNNFTNWVVGNQTTDQYLGVQFVDPVIPKRVAAAGRSDIGTTPVEYFVTWYIHGSNTSATTIVGATTLGSFVTNLPQQGAVESHNLDNPNNLSFKYLIFHGAGLFGTNPGLSFLQYYGYQV
jgi:hypothetical protein